MRVFEKKTVFGDKLKHVIEPRATYRYVTGVGTDFNRYILFDPTDLVANTSQLEISLTNRIYAKRGNSVQEIFSWELMQARFFDPTFGGALQPGQRNVFGATAILSGFAFVGEPRTDSPIISRMRVITPINGLRFTWQADYDPARSGISNSTFLLDYTWKKFVTSIGNNSIHANPALTPNANQYVFSPVIRRCEPPRMECRRGVGLRLPTGADLVYHDPGHLQHGLLRRQRAIPPVSPVWHWERQPVPRVLCGGQHRFVRNDAQTGSVVLGVRNSTHK